jgi:energy-coupling factor transport system ATP-binding protein
VRVGELSTNENSIQELVEQVGLVLQDPETQIFGITVFEDMLFGPSNLGLPRDEILLRVRQALELVGLRGYEERVTHNLSGGEMQRLAIAGILAMRPEILALDEPTSELDPGGRLDVLETIERLRAQNQTTILFVDHDAESVLRLADRVVVMSNGKIGWLGEPEELFRNSALTAQFSIRPPQMAGLCELLKAAGLISAAEIVLNVEAAEELVRRLLGGRRFSSEPVAIPPPAAAERSAVIEVLDLKHSYADGTQALAGITCAIQPGEFIAVIGQNGAGKSTLVRHFNGLLLPSSGILRVNGIDTRALNSRELASQVGYVFQNPDHQIFSNSVEEEIRFGLKNLGMSSKEQERRIEAALDFVGLQAARKRHPFTLGKGERQKIAVASILAIAPPVICIDEPTTGLDWQGTLHMMELICKLHEKGHTIIMITHNMELVAGYAQRVLWINQGRLLLDAPPVQVFTEAGKLPESGIHPPAVVQLVERLADLNCPQDICTIPDLVQAIKISLEA